MLGSRFNSNHNSTSDRLRLETSNGPQESAVEFSKQTERFPEVVAGIIPAFLSICDDWHSLVDVKTRPLWNQEPDYTRGFFEIGWWNHHSFLLLGCRMLVISLDSCDIYIYPTIYLLIYQYIHLYIYLSTRLFIYVCLFVCLNLCPEKKNIDVYIIMHHHVANPIIDLRLAI